MQNTMGIFFSKIYEAEFILNLDRERNYSPVIILTRMPIVTLNT